MNIDELEKMRKKKIREFIKQRLIFNVIINPVMAVMVCIVIRMGTKTTITYWMIFLFCSIFLVIIYMNLRLRSQTEFYEEFQKYIILRGTSESGPFEQLKYDSHKSIQNRDMYEAMLKFFKNISVSFSFGTYGHLSAIYRDISFEYSRMRIVRFTGPRGKLGVSAFFMGTWLMINCNEFFDTEFYVIEKGIGYSRSKMYNLKGEKYKKVKIGINDLDKKYNIYIKKQHVVTDILIQKIQEIIQRLSNVSTGKLFLCFVNNKVHVGIHTGKIPFRASIFKKIDEEKINNEISNVKVIADVIDELHDYLN